MKRKGFNQPLASNSNPNGLSFTETDRQTNKKTQQFFSLFPGLPTKEDGKKS